MKEDTTMKKYIKPETTIEKMSPAESILGMTTPTDGYSNAEQLNNGGFFDDLEDSYPPKDKGLWDDAYNDDKNK